MVAVAMRGSGGIRDRIMVTITVGRFMVATQAATQAVTLAATPAVGMGAVAVMVVVVDIDETYLS